MVATSMRAVRNPPLRTAAAAIVLRLVLLAGVLIGPFTYRTAGRDYDFATSQLGR